MKPSRILVVFFALAVIGGAALFYYQYQLPDIKFINRDVSERLLEIDSLDSSVSELALRSRGRIDNNYDMLVRSTTSLDQAIEDLEVTYFADATIEGTLLGRRFVDFRSELTSKNDSVENFKSHNSVLLNSEIFTPIVGRELMIAAQNQKLPKVAKFYSDLILEFLEYARPGLRHNAAALKELLVKIPETENQMPAEFLSQIIELTNHVATVIVEKEQTDAYLSEVLSSTSDGRLEDLFKAWNSWLLEVSKEQEKFDIAVLIYIALLLLFTGFIALKLRGLYSSLDGEVALQTAEVKKAYEDLSQSEKQLMQAEKMASLGQLVAGVAHEINTPLGYITCNVDTVRLNIDELKVILSSLRLMSEVVTQKPLNTKKLGEVVKSSVLAYREIKKRNTISGIEELLKDSSYGLNEISQLVSSLKDFSRLDSSKTESVSVHTGLDTTIKICRSAIGNRKLIRSYASDLPNIECMPAQLNQVFMNILNNAAQATNESEGIIEIETKTVERGIKINFKDNGHGMDEETCDRMFDPFFTTKEVNEGTGLGMSISYKIIKSHGGEISVESEPGHGTQIILLLPIAQISKISKDISIAQIG